MKSGRAGRLVRQRVGQIDLPLLIVGFLTVQSLFLFTPRIYDPIEYFFIASRLEEAGAFHRSLRIGLVGPIRLVQEFLGYSEVAYYVIPLVAGLVLTVAIYYLGRLLFGRVVGLLAAAIVVANPLVLAQSSQIYPDIPSAAMFTAAIALVVAAGIRYRNLETADRRVLLFMASAGVLLGWAYLIREFVVFLFPVVIVVMLIYRLPFRAWLLLATMALFMFGAEIIWGWVRYGDPIIRLRELTGGRSQPGQLMQERISRRAAATDDVLTKLATLPKVLGVDVPGLMLFSLGLVGVLGAPFLRHRGLTVLAAWTVLYWALLMATYLYVDEFGRPVLRATLTRYWYPLLPSFVIGGLGAVQVASRQCLRPARSLQTVAGVGLVVLAAGVASVVPLYRSGDRPVEFHEFRSWLANNGQNEAAIWTDQRTGWLLPLYTGTPLGRPLWDGQLFDINVARRFRPVEYVDRGFVVYQDDFFRAPLSGWRGAVPDAYINPPRDWKPVFTTSESRIVVYKHPAPPTGERLYEVDGKRVEWDLIGEGGVLDRSDGTSEVAVEVAGSAVLTADPSASGRTPVAVTGGSVRFTLDVAVVDTWIDFECAFWDAQSGFARTDGTTLYYPTEQEVSVEYVCAVPEETGDNDVVVRPWITLSGEGQATVGKTLVDWFPDSKSD